MARLFTSGIETGGTSEFEAISGMTASTVAPHTGVYAVRGTVNSHYVQKTVAPSPSDEIYIRTWWYPTGNDNGIVLLVGTSDSTLDVRFNYINNAFTIRRGTTVIATGTYLVPSLNRWYMLELYAKLANSPNGVATLKIDGNVDIAFTGGDTLSSASAAITYVRFVCGAATAGYHDDIAINDTSGAADNSWCGDGRVIGIKPDAVGDQADFTPSAGANWENADDVPSDDDTTCNESATDGHIDLLNLEACGLSSVAIRGVDVKWTARKTIANGDKQRAKIKTGGTVYDGATDKVLTTSYKTYAESWRTNPNTSIAWTIADIDALQVGYENRPA